MDTIAVRTNAHDFEKTKACLKVTDTCVSAQLRLFIEQVLDLPVECFDLIPNDEICNSWPYNGTWRGWLCHKSVELPQQILKNAIVSQPQSCRCISRH
eukprot:2385153-Amphidinium_carterae.1